MKIITPEISVIIPVYRAHSTLERAISSINNQLYDELFSVIGLFEADQSFAVHGVG